MNSSFYNVVNTTQTLGMGAKSTTEGLIKILFGKKVLIAMMILALILVIALGVLGNIKDFKETQIELISGLVTLLFLIFWWYLYKFFDGFDIILKDRAGSLNQKAQIQLWWFELFTFIIPIGLIWYRWYYSINNVLNKPEDELREILLQQSAREDLISAGIPVILFGVGVIYDQQKFTLNRYLLGGAFFGTVVPFLIDSVIISTLDVSRLFYFTHIKFMFIIIGITMILMSLYKYFHFRKSQKEQEKSSRFAVPEIPQPNELGQELEKLIHGLIERKFTTLYECLDEKP